MTVELVLCDSEATADQAFKAARSVRGYPLCGHRQWVKGVVYLCVRGRDHEGGHEPDELSTKAGAAVLACTERSD